MSNKSSSRKSSRLNSPRTRGSVRQKAASPPTSGVDLAGQAQIDRAVRAALRRERQLREARERYRRRHRDQLRRKARDRRGGGQQWTLPPEVDSHDPKFCTPDKGHHPRCRHHDGPREPFDGKLPDEPDPEKSPLPQRRKPRVKPVRQAVRLPEDWRGPDGFGPQHPARPDQAFDARGKRRVRIDGQNYVIGSESITDEEF